MPIDEDSSYSRINLTKLAEILTQAAVATPAVVQAPANTAPSAPAVQQAVVKVAEAIAPVVAPSVPRQAVLSLAFEIANEVTTNPTIIKASANTAIPASVATSIASGATKTVATSTAAQLDALAAKVQADANTAIAELKDLGVGGSPKSTTTAPFTTPMTISGQVDTSTSGAKKPAVQPFTTPMTISGQTPVPTDSKVTKNIKDMTQEEIDAITAAQIAAGGQSNDQSLTIPGETNAQRNARITAGYKKMLAQPILSQAAKDAGATVEFVRTGAGGVGSYTVVTPVGYTGPKITTTEWTEGIIPANSPYISGTTLGVMSDGKGGYTQVGTTPIATKTPTPTPTPTPNKGFENKNGVLYYNGVPFSGKTPDGKTYTNGIVEEGGTTGITTTTGAPLGTPPAYVLNSQTGVWEQPTKPTTPGNWVWDNLNGWVDSTVTPGASGTNATSTTTLAKDTFKNTLALYFGAKEMSQPWVDALYSSVSSFYKTGSTVQEALNLSLADIRNNPVLKPFTDRFKGVYALQDRLAKGEAISVPTIAEFFKSESELGDIMRNAGLGDLATQEYLGAVLGTGKSVSEASNIISDVFTAIDNAPKSLKDTLSQYFPGVDRVSLAKALLTGPEGAAELSKKVKQVSVLSAAGTQGLTVDMATAGDIAAMGYDYGQSLTGFGQVARELGTYQKIKEMETGKRVSTAETQTQLQNVVFGKDIQDQLAIEAAAQREANRFRGQAGNIGSKAFASQIRGMLL